MHSAPWNLRSCMVVGAMEQLTEKSTVHLKTRQLMSTTHRTDTGPSSGQTAMPSLKISLLGPVWAFDESGLSVSPTLPYTAVQEAVAGRPAPPVPREGLRQGGCGCPVGRAPCWSWLQKNLWGFFFFFAKAVLANAKGKAAIYIHVCESPSLLGSSIFSCLLKNKMSRP